MTYSVLYTDNDITNDISSFVTSIQFGGDVQSAVRKLDISIINGTDNNIPKLSLRKGGILTVWSEEAELIRAVIFKEDRNDKGDIKLSGYTHGIYLTKNKDTLIFQKMKASGIIQNLCSEFGISIGTIEDTEIEIPRLILRDKTLWDMMIIALTKTSNQNGVKYRLFFKEGKLNLCKRKNQCSTWVLEQGTNLISARSSSSIEDMRNQVKITGKSCGEMSYTSGNEEMQKLYGVMQEFKEESGEDLNEVKLKQFADTMLKDLCKVQVEASVEAMGIDTMEAGMAVYVIEEVTGLKSSFYVKQDDHSIEGNNHTMSLVLAMTDELPELEYEEPSSSE